jgi:hypothetical protein
MVNFKCDTDWIEGAKTKVSDLHNLIEEVHLLGSELLKKIESGDEWQGSANVAGASFLSMTVELNRLLGSASGGPIKEAEEGIGEYIDNDSAFYDEWYDYQEVKKL